MSVPLPISFFVFLMRELTTTPKRGGLIVTQKGLFTSRRGPRVYLIWIPERGIQINLLSRWRGTQDHSSHSIGSGLKHRSRKGLMVGLIRDTCPAIKRVKRIRPKIIILSECSVGSSDQRERVREKQTLFPAKHSWRFIIIIISCLFCKTRLIQLRKCIITRRHTQS